MRLPLCTAALVAGDAVTGGAAAGLPPFTRELGDKLWEQAKEEAQGASYEGNEAYVCGGGTGSWGDGPQCNQWDQGRSPCWPSSMTVAASWDTELMARWSVEMAQEFGIPGRGQLGPGINLARFAWNGRLGEYIAGEDPFFASAMVSAMVKAYRTVEKPPLIVAKHFIPNTIEDDRNGMTESVDERTLFEVYYPPFQAAIDAGLPAIMCSYNLVKCTSGLCSAGAAYACANDDVLNKHLKEVMGFKGIVMSDWDATKCQDEAADSGGCSAGSYIDKDYAAASGLDVEMPDCQTFAGGLTGKQALDRARRMHWANLVQGRAFGAGRRLAARGNRSATASSRRLTSSGGFCCWFSPGDGADLCAKCVATDVHTTAEKCNRGSGTWCGSGEQAEQGMSEVGGASGGVADAGQEQQTGKAGDCAPLEACPVEAPSIPKLCPDADGDNYRSPCKLALANRIIAESTVVLKNEGSVLPLSKTDGVALVGSEACADDPLAQGGGSGWNGFACNEVPKINVRNGIRGLKGGPKLSCPDGDGDNPDAASADVVVAIVAPEKAGEGSDRPTLQLKPADVDLIRKHAKSGKKVVVVINAPGPMITSTWDAAVSAVLITWLPGQQNGRGIAMALYNDGYGASGRLPFTFPRCKSAECSGADERASVALGDKIDDMSDRSFDEKALIGYRWYHAKGRNVSYPFGFGLFAYGSGEVRYSKVEVTERGHTTVEVSVQLESSARTAGSDVPQLYISFPKSVPGDEEYKPEWVLKGFAKVALEPGRAKTVTFPLTSQDLSYWDDAPGQSRWKCAGGTFRACVGANARDAVASGSGACTTFKSPCGGAAQAQTSALPTNASSSAQLTSSQATLSQATTQGAPTLAPQPAPTPWEPASMAQPSLTTLPEAEAQSAPAPQPAPTPAPQPVPTPVEAQLAPTPAEELQQAQPANAVLSFALTKDSAPAILAPGQYATIIVGGQTLQARLVDVADRGFFKLGHASNVLMTKFGSSGALGEKSAQQDATLALSKLPQLLGAAALAAALVAALVAIVRGERSRGAQTPRQEVRRLIQLEAELA